MKNCNLLELYDNIYEEIEQTDAIITTLSSKTIIKDIINPEPFLFLITIFS